MLAVAGLVQWNQHRSDTRITVLPLSGGDAIFADAPGRANDLLVDCGSESAARFVVTPFLHGQGLNRLPHLLLTHGDLRHIGGTGLIEKEFSVGEVLTSNARFRSAAYRQIVGELELAPRRWRQVNRGDRFGYWTILHPATDNRFSEADDNALVEAAGL